MAREQDKVIFLDRDGVINVDPENINEYGYVRKWEEFRFLPGSKEAIRKLTAAGYSVYIISNQAGVSKGHFTASDLADVTRRMGEELEKEGGRITDAYYCIHRSEDNCDCRKPKSGLLKKALEHGDIDFGNTYFIGDNTRDVEAGKAAGCRTVLVLSGKIKTADTGGWRVKPDHIKKDLLEAVEFILRTEDK